LKRLGIACAYCFIIKGDEADERLWKLAELIHQPERKVLDWAVLVMEWVELVREKGAHVAHPRGGRQPHDKGLAAAERVLGVSRRDLGRAARIASISPEAQQEIRRAGLDDIQRALLEIANTPPDEQVEKARELKERYRKPRLNRPTNADRKPGADARQGDVLEHEAASQEPAEEEDDELEEETVESPDTVPAEASCDTDQPSAFRRRAGDDEKFEILKSRWDEYLADDWDQYLEDEWRQAPEAVQLRFIKEVFGCSVRMAGKDHKSHH
jgi:hypothetical protein